MAAENSSKRAKPLHPSDRRLKANRDFRDFMQAAVYIPWRERIEAQQCQAASNPSIEGGVRALVALLDDLNDRGRELAQLTLQQLLLHPDQHLQASQTLEALLEIYPRDRRERE